jgi:lysophospholipase L1-like esterase
MKKKLLFSGILTSAILLTATTLSAEITVKKGEKIGFLGDSITAQGNSMWCGYVNLVMSALNANGIKAVKVPAGISGHKSNQMLARLDKDVLSKKPQYMTLSCGVNDVWHDKRGVPLDQYKANITKIVEKAQAAGVKVYILTATMISENQQAKNNQKLIAYNDFLRQLAKEKNCVLVDLNKDMQEEIAAIKKKYPNFKGNYLTVDGVHMNPLGNMMMARGILKAFGFSDEQMKKATDAWMKSKYTMRLNVNISTKEYMDLSAKAVATGKNAEAYSMDAVRNAVKK